MSDPLDRLRQILLQDGALRERLGVLEHGEAFASALAGERPTADELAALSDAIRQAQAGEPGAPAWRLEQAPPADWLPVELALAGEELLVVWLWFGAAPPAEAYFYQSAERAARLPLNALLRCATPLAALDRWHDAPPPSGFIAHMSRCGSTLAANMLAGSRATVVISEAPVLDTMIHLAARAIVPESMVARLAAALLRRRERRAAHGVIKLDAWHTLLLPLLRRAFPRTPFVFLYRDPVEVLVSHARNPGQHVIPGALALEGLGLAGVEEVAPAAYPAFVLDAICRAALEVQGDPLCLLVNYSELPEACETRIAPHFGISADAAMRAAARFDAKALAREFASDSGAKQAEASPETRSHAASGLDRSYVALETARLRSL